MYSAGYNTGLAHSIAELFEIAIADMLELGEVEARLRPLLDCLVAELSQVERTAAGIQRMYRPDRGGREADIELHVIAGSW